ncbi:hypothetical protein B0H67DRAFT_324134 [Lasiosphaeris hirsuta]|uniref:Uncharacterized protein n=1 Tax=Lasiosphaeris hirsuta TaxID=260670 RepID=A0AA40A257_9PEZI|nr:hypothetical protein B0H67DRAFT_324134 [Lasiosphaeris hirsuta]
MSRSTTRRAEMPLTSSTSTVPLSSRQLASADAAAGASASVGASTGSGSGWASSSIVSSLSATSSFTLGTSVATPLSISMPSSTAVGFWNSRIDTALMPALHEQTMGQIGQYEAGVRRQTVQVFKEASTLAGTCAYTRTQSQSRRQRQRQKDKGQGRHSCSFERRMVISGSENVSEVFVTGLRIRWTLCVRISDNHGHRSGAARVIPHLGRRRRHALVPPLSHFSSQIKDRI